MDGEDAIPFLALDACLGAARLRPRVAVVLGGQGARFALGLDRIRGVRDAVIQPLPEMAPACPLALGVSLDDAGDPCLVLDPAGLGLAAREPRPQPVGGGAAKALPLLVVDDSLTTRMLELSILETAGYAVDLAASAEEGLARLRERHYGLMLVDVEMPGMNGFELLELLKGEPGLKEVPAILVTSCSSPEDRRRGAAAGARDYIVKGEFDQSRLLGRIRELLP
jgi:two-component system chemotaxis sensor kinase CheA